MPGAHPRPGTLALCSREAALLWIRTGHLLSLALPRGHSSLWEETHSCLVGEGMGAERMENVVETEPGMG